jgi:hypothetical protein
MVNGVEAGVGDEIITAVEVGISNPGVGLPPSVHAVRKIIVKRRKTSLRCKVVSPIENAGILPENFLPGGELILNASGRPGEASCRAEATTKCARFT